jgi:hypothetical protein
MPTLTDPLDLPAVRLPNRTPAAGRAWETPTTRPTTGRHAVPPVDKGGWARRGNVMSA